MNTIHRPDCGGQPRQRDVAQTDGTTGTPLSPPSRPGFVLVPDAFLDARIEPLTPSEKIVLLNIEARAGGACWSFPGNHELAKKTGRSLRAIIYILESLQVKGYIQPVMKTSGREYRICFLILKRANRDRAVFDPDHDSVDEIVKAVCERRRIDKPAYALKGCPVLRKDKPKGEKKNGSAMGAQSASSEGAQSAFTVGAQSAPESEEVVSFNQRNFNQTEDHGISVPLTKRPEADPLPTPEPEPPKPSGPPRTPHRAIAEPKADVRDVPLTAGLTAGQQAFLASLDDDRRAAFDALGQGKRDHILEPHVRGFDPGLADFQVRNEIPRRAPAPPRPMPATTEELIEQLPGACPAWSTALTEDLVQRFGRKEDRKLWGELYKVAMAIRDGRIDPGHVISAYRQAMKPGIKRPGAKFWAALKALTGLTENDL